MISQPVQFIYFYGAGCSSDDKRAIIEVALQSVFKNAEIVVEHDLLGAAIGVCGSQAGITAILGTGSNSCYFDGRQVVENIPALGYVLGDEGSGAYIGKEVLKGYLNKEMEGAILQKFEMKFHLWKRYWTGFIRNHYRIDTLHHFVNGLVKKLKTRSIYRRCYKCVR